MALLSDIKMEEKEKRAAICKAYRSNTTEIICLGFYHSIQFHGHVQFNDMDTLPVEAITRVIVPRIRYLNIFEAAHRA